MLSELRQEALDLDRSRKERDAAEVQRLVALKRELLARAPDADDSTMPEPSSGDIAAVFAWHQTLAAFDAIAVGRRKPLREGQTTAEAVLAILGAKIGALQAPSGAKANHRPDLDDLAIERGNLEEEHNHWKRESDDDVATSPGVALIALEIVLRDLNPPPTPARDIREFAIAALQEVMSGKHDFREAVYGRNKGEALAKPLAKCKVFAEQVFQGLLLKIGSRRSLRTVLARYKTRCQTHDRKRMQALALDPEVTEPELTAQLALWLFDQGFNPLTEVPIAGIRPDILDASKDPSSSLYVEAKQYKRGDPLVSRVKRAMYQIYSSVGRLRGDHIDVSEAFLVIFRRGGPVVRTPPEVRSGELVVFIELIDIAPEAESGSRATDQPVTISVDDLLPTAVDSSSTT